MTDAFPSRPWTACEYCGNAEPFVRLRKQYNEPDVVLCAPCWLDLQMATQKARSEE